MRSLDPRTVEATPETQELLSIRDRLVQEIRTTTGKGQSKGKGKQELTEDSTGEVPA